MLKQITIHGQPFELRPCGSGWASRPADVIAYRRRKVEMDKILKATPMQRSYVIGLNWPPPTEDYHRVANTGKGHRAR